jgi:hypothetical protein
MAFRTLDDILAHRFSGDRALDANHRYQIDQFCSRDDIPKHDRMRAYNHMLVESYGEEPATEQEFDDYLDHS